ncbi:MAG TPA: pectate lyase [Candidatus Hydrogenedentes bacterium]|nr:pectate lyase [Candidatus Hydrogenedentota bacterium]HRT18892.1 pectate lyase [Candidatus Hydrogenedentota bacterium]HRT64996.1 pectate lyase [Candidatus Hydrogenedentota bacterium]
MRRLGAVMIVAAAVVGGIATAQGDDVSPDEARKTLRRATAFFREQVSTCGGYLWRYSADLSRREGEGKATNTMIWVQPPGTPAVGMAFLDVYKWTGERRYLDAAVEAAHALVKGQLQSGGWEYHVEFDPEKRKQYAYRSDGLTTGRNTTTLDDNTTQAALRLIICVDHVLDFKDAAIHEAALYGLDALIKAQYPNGAWPQRYSAFPDPAKHPVKPAGYPETWARTYPGLDYKGFYTLNDNTLADTIATMFLAAEIYGDDRFRQAALRGGDFILLAQMPDPQPAWAQQYDFDMYPAWARKFEPPAVTGGESQGVLRILLDLHEKTGDRRYLESVGRALDYLKRSRLPDGKLARFYELRTNKPIYFTKAYKLTYSDDDLPTHYAFVSASRLEAIEADYRAALEKGPGSASAQKITRQSCLAPKPHSVSPDEARAVMAAMDGRGAWVERGGLRYHGSADETREVIDVQTFIQNMRTLGAYIAGLRHETDGKAR